IFANLLTAGGRRLLFNPSAKYEPVNDCVTRLSTRRAPERLALHRRVRPMTADHLSTTFAALADPTRRAILARLTAGEASVTELAEPFDMSMPAVSKHLKVLERAGLVARGREAQWRP